MYKLFYLFNWRLSKMQTLTVNNKINVKGLYDDYLFYSDVQSTFFWGKCYINDETKEVQFMQIPGTCKDYVVDTYYRTSTHGYTRNLWQEEQIKYPSVCISSNKSYIQKYIQHVKEVLNPWEEKHGFIPTEAFKVDFGDTKLATQVAAKGVIVIKFDPVWMTNSMTMSFFLSIVRHTMQTGIIQFKDSERIGFPTNEQAYYNRQSSDLKSVIDYSIENPRDYLDQMKDATSTGYPTNPNTHGCTGLFSIMSALYQKYADRSEIKQMYIKNKKQEDHPNGRYIEYVLKKLKQEKEAPQDVKMQSLQPKVKRSRTRKTTTTTTPQPAWPFAGGQIGVL